MLTCIKRVCLYYQSAKLAGGPKTVACDFSFGLVDFIRSQVRRSCEKKWPNTDKNKDFLLHVFSNWLLNIIL